MSAKLEITEPGHWRSLQELAGSKELEDVVHREFQIGASEWKDPVSRRKFLKLMGASMALAGVSACTRQAAERIVPYVRQPEELIPGKPLFFASALTLAGYARGVLVETHEGRPTKIEGNPEHPASLGASDIFMQAEILVLYDPDRSQAILNNGQISTWESFLGYLTGRTQNWKTDRGAGLRLLTRHETSPTFVDQMQHLMSKYPAAKWHEYEPVATRDQIYHFDKAEVIFSIGGDFLSWGPASLKYQRDFAAWRRATDRPGSMNRLYVVESTPSITGAMADHRLALSPDRIARLVREIQTRLESNEIASSVQQAKFISALVADLQQHTGKSLVIAGEHEAPAIQEFARWCNELLRNVNRTVEYSAPTAMRGGLAELVNDINAGGVKALLIIGGNPVYDAPVDLEFGKTLDKVPISIHMGLYANETAEHCQWHIPEAHALESWSDACAFDGTATIMQPVIEPLFAGKSRHQLLAALLEDAASDSYDLVRAYWQTQLPAPDFEKLWRKSLYGGVVVNWREPIKGSSFGGTQTLPLGAEISGLYLLIRADPHIGDGMFSNNAWLQELPKPLTKLVWDNAALISPATAERLQLASEDLVLLKYRGRSVQAPVWVLPGQADDCVTVHLGYGRARAGNVGSGVGFNVNALRTSDALWGGPGLQIEKTGQRHTLVTTQHHYMMEDRHLVRAGTVAEFEKNPASITRTDEPPPAKADTLYGNYRYKDRAWGMAIDLNTCIGCNACTIACQAENNIPVVGKEQVAAGREMHWIRVDRYFIGGVQDPKVFHQPVPCMHCENAPCELVCPVGATVHSEEGLNQMVYNRCIGTRFCSNNCPYKVRRFNFLEYDANRFESPISLKLMRNPDVTVRSRGVMEKCTYCVQRINAVKIEAEKANRAIRDGEITPACAQACPAEAIIFGDINDPNSRVAKLKASPLNYALLQELNTRPRTTYLAKLRNPNPEVEKA
ncbi:MAG: TAT-variant-translocated molybdopterin oxidoreductase [Verrucomicrobia bacterium]|nr:TAT-variant-translocated molybdopterin oxidoreductase [Verrucomicrobiota bacterium]